MGKSKSIEQQQQSNAEFQRYIDNMNADLEKRVGAEAKKIDSLIEEHYKLYPDKAELLLGSYQHLSTVSEWSLDSVNKILEGCRKAIFGANPPAGIKSDKPAADVSAAISEIKERELYIANAAFEVVQGALSSFTSKTTTSVMTKTEVKNLSPGLTLFISVMENSYSRKDFFTNESIIQNLFYFKVYYSIKEGQQVSKLSDLKAYEDQKATYRKLLQKQNERIMTLDVTDPGFELQLQKIDKISELLNNSLGKISEKIESLTERGVNNALLANHNNDTFDGDAILCSIKEAKNKLLAVRG